MLSKTSKLAAVVAAAGAFAAAPQAAQAITMRLGDPQLTAKMAITVPVVVTCSPFDPGLTFARSGLSVSAQQAAGKAIAYGYGSIDSYGFGQRAFTCDGSEQTVPVTVMANTNGAPFHGGKAVISAYAFATAGVPCYPEATTCFYETATQTGSTGAVEAKL
jgi:hypothetical protein